MLAGPVETIRKARSLRKAMSLPEMLLWRELRARPAGLKFRRQQAAGRYILDFYCHEARLAVEIDGEAHNRGDRPARDARRDAWLMQNGVTVLRIAAVDVLADLDAVIRLVFREAERVSPLHQPRDEPGAGPPPL